MTIARPRRTALHEAAHAVVGEFFGVKVKRVWIDGRSSGGVSWDRRAVKKDYPYRFIWACISLAGTVAEHQFARVPKRLWSKEDYSRARAAIGDGPRMHAAKQLTFSMVVGMKRDIANVAGALMERDLAGAEVRELLAW